MTKYTPGDFVHRLEFLFPTNAPDGAGGSIRTHASRVPNPLKIWAAQIQTTGLERVLAGQNGAVQGLKFIIWFRPGLSTDMRVRYQSVVYEIDGPPRDPDGSKTFLELTLESNPLP